MFPRMQSSQQRYENLPISDVSSQSDFVEEKHLTAPIKNLWSSFIKVTGLVITALIGIIGILSLGYTLGFSQGTGLASQGVWEHARGNCTTPYYRREWRSLSKVEKRDYLDAFQCFIDSPSILGMNGSLYNDFSWVHNLVAHSTHTKASFLSWHRRFVFVYEKHLRTSCGYKGALPFWDWSLDWEDPPGSPIFDSKLGFGGDGDRTAPMHESAHCVTDSPFKNLKPQWYGEKYDPHCLTRFFDEDWFAHYLNPEALEKVMSATNYADFFLALEMGPHDIIPLGIRGDFTSFTAPNDPIFYLHHSQLDRMWWLWQQRDRKTRMTSYGGVGDRGVNVTLTDVVPLAGLDRDLTVADIMDTEGGEMCYRYMYA